MQGTSIAFSPSISLPTNRINLINVQRLKNPLSHVSFSQTPKLTSISFSLSKPNKWISTPISNDSIIVHAKPDSGSIEEAPKSNTLTKTLVLGALFGFWYLFNIYFNIYNKQVLKPFHYPFTVTMVQFAVGTVLVTLMWTLNLYKRPKISWSQLVAILPLAVVHVLGNLFTNII